MNNDIKIQIISTLNTGLSIKEINMAIRGIEKKVDKLKLKVDIDDKILQKMDNFSKQMSKLAKIAQNTGKVIQEVTNPDGSKFKQTSFDGIKTSFEEIAKKAKKVKEETDTQRKSVDELTQSYKKLVSEQSRYDKSGDLKGTTSKYTDNKGNARIVNTNAKNEVISYKDIENIAQFEKAQASLRKELGLLSKTGQYTTSQLREIGKNINLASSISQLDQMKKKMGNMKFDTSLQSQQENLKASLKSLFNQAKITEAQFNNFGKNINATKSIAEINKIEKAMSNLAQKNNNASQQSKLLNQANSMLNSPIKGIDKTTVNGIITNLNGIKPSATNAANALKQIEIQLKAIKSSANDAGQTTKTLGEQLGNAASKFGIWMAAGTMIYAPIRALEDMTSRLIEIDSLMVNLQRVMDAPSYQFADLLTSAVETSDQLASKLTDVLGIMGEFARMGDYSNQELINVSSTAQVLQNISDLDATAAVDTLTSAMQNYNVSASESIQIADKLNEVDNRFAISTADLSDGIRKAASTASTFGVNLDELVGYIAAIGSTTRESGAIIGKIC